MTKHDILEVFKDINFMYNDSTRLDTLSCMIDELQEEWNMRNAQDKTSNKEQNAINCEINSGIIYDMEPRKKFCD